MKFRQFLPVQFVLAIVSLFFSLGQLVSANQSLSLDGDGDYVDLSTPLPDMTELTIEVWAYYASSNNDVKTIFMDATTHGGNDLVLDMNASGIGIRADKNGSSSGYEGAGAVTGLNLGNGWHHIAWSMTPKSSTIYVDGILKAVRNITGSNVGYHAQSASIGRWWDEGGSRNYFAGLLDEMRIWNSARTQDEIQTYMNTELTGGENGLVGYWNFNGDPNDLSVNANHGQLHGDATIVDTTFPPASIVLQKNIDLGSSLLGETDSGSITIQNTSNQELQIQNITAEIAEIGIEQTAISISPWSSENVSFTLTPISVGQISGQILVQTDRSPNPEVISISTQVLQPLETKSRLLQLDGDGDYVRIQRSDKLSLANTVTLECWLNRGTHDQWELIVGNGGGWSNKGYHIMSSPQGGVRFELQSETTKSILDSNTIIDDQWYHVAATYNGNTMSIYINGYLDVSMEHLNGMNSQETDLGIAFGLYSSYDGSYFEGQIDEVRVWNAARSQEEIRANMNQPLVGPETGLVGYWNFDHGVAIDASGNDNHGTLYGDASIIEADFPYSPIVTQNNIDIGSSLMEESRSANFTIKNASDQELQIQNITADIAAVSVEQTALSVPSWSSANIDFTFTPTNTGQITGQISVQTSASVTPETITVTAEVLQPLETKSRILDLDGDGDYIEIPGGVWFDGDSTIEAWVFVRKHSNWSRIIDFGNGSGADNVLFALSIEKTGRPTFEIYSDHSGGRVDSNIVIETDSWVHLACSLKENLGTVYMNGIEVGSKTLKLPPRNVLRKNNYIGRSNWPQYDPDTDAMLDEIRIWNVARSQEAIRANMNQPLVGPETGLVGYWNFDQGVAMDTSGDGNHGTLHGNASIVEADFPTISSEPLLSIQPSSIEANQSVGLLSKLTFRISNLGQQDLIVSDITSGLARVESISETSFTIPFRETKQIEINYVAKDWGTQTGTLEISSNALNSPTSHSLTIKLEPEKIVGPWLWLPVVTGEKQASAIQTDWLYESSNGQTSEKEVAVNGPWLSQLGWQSAQISPNGNDNINDLMINLGYKDLGQNGDIDLTVAYGFIYVHSPQAQTSQLFIGSDDAVKVWLNGEVVWEHSIARAASDFQEFVPVNLQTGNNFLLVAIYEDFGLWSGFFGLTDSDNLTYSTTPVVNYNNWQAGLTVTSPNSALASKTLYFGASPQATTDFDADLDRVAPPNPSPPILLDVFFPLDGTYINRLYTNIHPAEQSQIYPLQVQADQDGFSLNWQQAFIPAEYSSAILHTADRRIDMRQQNQAEFASGKYEFKIVLLNQQDWMAQIRVASSNSDLAVKSLPFGVSASRVLGFDQALDQIAPPQPISPVLLDAYFPNAAEDANLSRLANRIQPFESAADSLNFTFVVRSDQDSFQLDWDSFLIPPNYSGAVLKTPTGRIDMRQVSSASFEPGTYTFQIELGEMVYHQIQLQPGWNMISIPGQPSNPDPAQLLEQGTGLLLPLYQWNPSQFTYQPVQELKVGQGYWALCLEDGGASFDIAMTPVNQHQLTLERGWNMIGGLSSQIDFSDPAEEPDESILPPAFSWNPIAFTYLQADQLLPGQGYWVLSPFRSCQLQLDTSTVVSSPAMARALEYKRQLALQISSGSACQELFLAWSEQATEELDVYDRFLPPVSPVSQGLDAWLENSGQRLQTDSRQMKLGQEWQLRLQAKEEIEISWSSQQLPTGTTLLIGEVDMRQSRRLTLERGEHQLKLQLVKRRDLPEVTQLYQNYPNPFNPETWIPFDLAEDAEVEIDIYDGKGKLVRKLSVGYTSAGTYRDRDSAAYWDGRNANGEQIASGVYFYQIQAGDYQDIRKMVILK